MMRWLPDVERIPAADYGFRSGYAPPTCIVIHGTGGGPARFAIDTLTAADDVYVSSHLIIARDGSRTQMVPFHRKAFHAGKSEWQCEGEMTPDVNRFSIGIELANHLRLYPDSSSPGAFRYKIRDKWFRYHGEEPVAAELKYDDGDVVRAWWEPYSQPQLDALGWTALELLDEWPGIELLGHEECAMPLGRKIDPGPCFPWGRFGRATGRRTESRILTDLNL